MSDHEITRRTMMKAGAATAAAAALAAGGTGAQLAMGAAEESSAKAVQKGRIKQAVCQWCYKWPMEEFCAKAQKLGLYGIDLVGPDWFPTLKKYNLVGTMTPSHGITKGLNRRENWDECLGKIRASIDATADAGFPCVICFSGNRGGMDVEQGLKICAEAVKQVVGQAE
jgi:hydroxypyruvate isomerase